MLITVARVRAGSPTVRERERRLALDVALSALEAELASTMRREIVESEDAEVVSTEGDDGAGSGSDEPWFDPTRLEGLGFAPGEIDHIREVFDDSVMYRLELADARSRNREKGVGPVVRDRLRAAERDELGDEGFDALLYASGEPNRVVISELVPGSPLA